MMGEVAYRRGEQRAGGVYRHSEGGRVRRLSRSRWRVGSLRVEGDDRGKDAVAEVENALVAVAALVGSSGRGGASVWRWG